ncbi:unnamed protein product [Parascedosporium putredinis]|uniref:Zn(2)-C6 fungal-type domain-containing protein n=1 Tax=Parascedosporium putredinis TaxID=1442378 RepID=A0A9P1MAG1_9PEZI|nr:unnamed protein product [Parascedosporium putredinis]CAI7993907.1 unnamed protein product [Parascedosporium putredinis]
MIEYDDNYREPTVQAAASKAQAQAPPAAVMSCLTCRARKLKCDRARPSCDRCAKLQETCEYPGARRRHVGPRRTVRDLEDRISRRLGLEASTLGSAQRKRPSHRHKAIGAHTSNRQRIRSFDIITEPELRSSTEMIRLGLFEQLPLPNLTDIYFERMHPALPMIHKARYLTSMNFPAHMRPPMCLQYIIMAIAAGATDTHAAHATALYQRARAYAEADEMKSLGGDFTTVAHAQTCLRIAHMLDLHKLDETACPLIPHALPPRAIGPRWKSAGGRGGSFSIFTFLPASEQAFETGVEESQGHLRTALEGSWPEYSAFAGRVLVAQLFHRTLDHSFANCDAGRRGPIDTFWREHAAIDDNLTLVHAFIPASSSSPTTRGAPAPSSRLPSPDPTHGEAQSQARLLPAAKQIVDIFRLVRNMHATLRNPLLAFAAYMAGMALLEELVVHGDESCGEDLQYLLGIMARVAEFHAVVRSVAAQLVEDMRQCGLVFPAMEKVWIN